MPLEHCLSFFRSLRTQGMSDFFQDKVAIVTGASSGIGLETAKLLSNRGSLLVLAARNKEKIESLSKELGRSLPVVTDVTQESSVQNLIAQTLDRFGKIDILINNAGILLYKPMQDCSSEEIQRILEVNFLGAVRCANAALPILKKQGQGTIVNVASIAGRIGLPNLGYYSSSKFALVAYSEALRQEVFHHNIFVTTVCPGTVLTPMTETILSEAKAKGKNSFPIMPQTVAKRILRAIEKKEREVFVPEMTRFFYWLHFFFPRFAEWLVWKFRASDPQTFRSS
ncbi:MAG: SDR family NAD(P)-dependent oxidoreductase [Elusimicrobia bacterium]|nr:SDR family NAD(P)-dependent oxidoreductase [Elusimicrobiota bacterium]